MFQVQVGSDSGPTFASGVMSNGPYDTAHGWGSLTMIIQNVEIIMLFHCVKRYKFCRKFSSVKDTGVLPSFMNLVFCSLRGIFFSEECLIMQWMMNEQDRFTRPEETVNDFSFNCPPNSILHVPVVNFCVNRWRKVACMIQVRSSFIHRRRKKKGTKKVSLFTTKH
jgi:hypothetical protein